MDAQEENKQAVEKTEGETQKNEIRKPGCCVFVGNLSYKTSWQGLKDHMKKVGNVAYADIFSNKYNESKGCGIVEFNTPEDAQKAIKELNESFLDGRQIFVREDSEEKKQKEHEFAKDGTQGGNQNNNNNHRGGFRGRGRYHRGGRGNFHNNNNNAGGDRYQNQNKDGTQIYVGNIPYTVTWQQLKDAFREHGNVLHADVPSDYMGRSRGFGLVRFESADDAQNAITAMNNSDFNGRQIYVKLDEK